MIDEISVEIKSSSTFASAISQMQEEMRQINDYFDCNNDCEHIFEMCKKLMKIREDRGFIIQKDIGELFDMKDVPFPYFLVIGNKEKYREWLEEEIDRSYERLRNLSKREPNTLHSDVFSDYLKAASAKRYFFGESKDAE